MPLPTGLRSVGLVAVDDQDRIQEWTPALAKMINADARDHGQYGRKLEVGANLWEVFELSEEEVKRIKVRDPEPIVKLIKVAEEMPRMALEMSGAELDPEDGEKNGSAPRLVVEVRDVTRRKLAEERVDNILETSFDGFWDWHIKADYEYMSPGFWSHFGYKPEEKEHRPSAWMDMINQEDLQMALGNLDKHVKTKGKHPYLQEVRYRHKDGSTVWVRCKGRVVEWAPDGSAIRMVGTHTDVTKLKLRLMEIKEQNEAIERERAKVARLHEELRILIEDANAPIFGVNREGEINVWNKTMARILNVPGEQAEGKPLLDFAFNDRIKEELRRAIDQALAGSGQTNLWIKLTSPSGKAPVSLLVNTTQRVSLEDGSAFGVFCLAQDVTELMQARENAIRERERASAETALNEFMAHEVRNPLAAALSACSFAREDIVSAQIVDDDSSVVNDLDVVRSSLSYIQELLTNVLDLNRHSTETMTLCPRRTLIRDDVLDPIVTMLSYRNKELEISLECENDLDVEVDSLRLKQIIMNVATNATKFTPKGFVRLRASAKPLETNPAIQRVTIAVEDSGRGIPADKHHKLFRRYCKLSTDMRGSGLGLCLSKKIIEQMGGSIVLDPDYHSGFAPDRPGCRFVIEVNLRTGGRSETPSQVSVASAPGARDETEECKSEESTTKSPATASGDIQSSSSSSAAAAAASPTPAPAAATKRARLLSDTEKKSEPPAPLPGLPPERTAAEQTAAAGTAAAAPTANAAPSPGSLPSHARALVVDDDMVVRMTVRRQLERLRLGWSFSEALNGEDALRKVGSAKDDPNMHYTIIVIDHFMPLTGGVMNGAETIAKLRALDPRLVIVGMSGNDQKAEHIRNGAQVFWPKPLPPSDRLRRDLCEAFVNIGSSLGEQAAKRRKLEPSEPVAVS